VDTLVLNLLLTVGGATLKIGPNAQCPAEEAPRQDPELVRLLPLLMVVQSAKVMLKRRKDVTLNLAQLMVDGVTLEIGPNAQCPAEEAPSQDPELVRLLPLLMVVQSAKVMLKRRKVVTLNLAQLMAVGVTTEVGLSVLPPVKEAPSPEPDSAPTLLQHMVEQTVKDKIRSHKSATPKFVRLDSHPGLVTSNGAVLEFQMVTLV